MAADLVVWHSPDRMTHATAAETAQALLAKRSGAAAHNPGVPAFAAELARDFPEVKRGGDGKGYLLLDLGTAVPAKAVPVIRYLAAKHRLVCFDTRQRAVTNPPLLRRVGAAELTAAGDLSIEDPLPEHIAEAVRDLNDEFWFVVLDHDDDHYVQGGLGPEAGAEPGRYVLEYREDEEHMRADVADAESLVAALTGYASNDPTWRTPFTWHPV